MSDKRSKPTPADKEAAARLRKIWIEAGQKPSQGQMVRAWGDRFGGGNQSLMSQYINGHIALNYRAVMFFADQLGVLATEIRSDLPEQQMSGDPGALATVIEQLRPDQREAVENLVRSMRGEPGPEELYNTGRWRKVSKKNSRGEQ